MEIYELEKLVADAKDNIVDVREIGQRLSMDESLTPSEQELLHLLCHFLADADIQNRDLAYAKHLANQVDAALAKVRQYRS